MYKYVLNSKIYIYIYILIIFSGNTFLQTEATSNWAKSSIQRDIPHVLKAIIQGIYFYIFLILFLMLAKFKLYF